MIKLKKILKESKYAWDRKFGDPLPTFKDVAETHQNKPKEELKEYNFSSKLPKLKVPSDVSYYGRDWEPVLKSWGSVDFGPRESDMYDWNSRANYQAATKEYHTHMSKVAKKLNTAVKELDGLYKVWNKVIDKHRKNDSSRDYEK